MSNPSLRLLAVACVLVIAFACDTLSLSMACPDDIRARFTPADTNMVVGDVFTASVQVTLCGGTQSVTDTFAWHSQDPTVASVDPRNGQVIGQGPGETRIGAIGDRVGLVGWIQVSVRAGAP